MSVVRDLRRICDAFVFMGATFPLLMDSRAVNCLSEFHVLIASSQTASSEGDEALQCEFVER